MNPMKYDTKEASSEILVIKTWDDMLQAMVSQEPFVKGDYIFRDMEDGWAVCFGGCNEETFSSLDNAKIFYRAKRNKVLSDIPTITNPNRCPHCDTGLDLPNYCTIAVHCDGCDKDMMIVTEYTPQLDLTSIIEKLSEAPRYPFRGTMVGDGVNALTVDRVIKSLRDIGENRQVSKELPKYGKDYGEDLLMGNILLRLCALPDEDEFSDYMDEEFFAGAWPDSQFEDGVPVDFKRDIRGMLYHALHPENRMGAWARIRRKQMPCGHHYKHTQNDGCVICNAPSAQLDDLTAIITKLEAALAASMGNDIGIVVAYEILEKAITTALKDIRGER